MRVLNERVRHPDQAFRFLRLELDAFRGERHRHPQLELTWIESGSGLRFVGDDAAAFGTNDLVLVGAGVAHTWMSTGRAAAGSAIATVLQFSPGLLDLPQLPELARFMPVAERAQRGLAIEGQTRQRVTAILGRMRRETALERVGSLLAALSALLERPRDQRELSSSRPPAAPGSRLDGGLASRRIDATLDWVHRNLGRRIAVAHAARIAHVTPAAFSRFFSREVGKTFSRYLNDARCSEACARLRTTDRPVAVIARDCGFTTLSHFNRQFRLRYGVTPREFRSSG